MSDSEQDPHSASVLALLEDAGEPESDDPGQWTPPEVIGLALMYAYGVDALAQRDAPGWSRMNHLCDDILFNRDLLQEWLELFSEDALEELVEEQIPDLPLPSEADVRLEQMYLEHREIRKFLENEYSQFRDDIAPPRHHRWWWLDAEIYGKQIH